MGFERRLWAMVVIYIIPMVMIDCCLEQERVALLQLKPEFMNLYKSSDCCIGWDGVVCDANGRVISLDISNSDSNSLNGEFNASVLLPFEQLQELDLSDNSITSWIETKGLKKVTSSLTKLKVLKLDNNHLRANIMSRLSGFPSLEQLFLGSNLLSGMILIIDIEAMKNLEELDLSSNSIEGFMSHDKSGSMEPSSSASVSKLHTLHLGSNPLKFNISILQHLNFQVFNNLEVLDLNAVNNVSFSNDDGKLSSSLPKLKTLHLWYNNLDSSFLPHLSALPSLSTLDLNCNHFGKLLRLNDFEAIRNLEEIYLANNGIEGIIIDGPVKLPQLKLLDLSWNVLNSSCLTHLRGLPSSLKHLWLDNNELEGVIDFQDIVGIRNLEDLTMSNNNIIGFKTSNGCNSNSTSLQKLDLYNNQISGEIPSCFESLPNLRFLNLSLNNFTGNIGKSPLVSLRSLEILQISQNQFKIPNSFKSFFNHTKLKYFIGDSNQVIPDDEEIEVGLLASGLQLEVLSLSNCGINGPLPNFLHQQHDMMFINLAHNSLQGNFPSWLMEKNPRLRTLLLINNSLSGVLAVPSHNNLWALDISQNKIEGHIPPNIGLLLPRLYVMNMSRNQFNENIPPSLCSMKSLQVLDLSNNRLLRGIEHLSKGCFQLVILDISNNTLEGEIPPELLNIKSLDLHKNRLSGGLNVHMLDTRYSQVGNLILSDNFLEGLLTKDICGLKLMVLDLSNNKLNGSVPSCLTNSSTLTFVFLGNNRFNGLLMLEFSNSSQLQTLDLSFNRLTGPIPSLIECQHSLRFLLLKGNFFYGQIPYELCELSQVAILDLSHNNLSGPIPHCRGKLTDPTGKGDFGWVEGLMTDLNLVIFGLLQVLGKYENDEYWWSKKNEDHVKFMTKSMTYNYKGDILQFMSGIDLSCNGLTGEVPRELGSLNWLHALNLSYNHLRGHIPMAFSNLKQMESLDLSYNLLNGSIPNELAELDSLGVFKVGYNNLSGKIPYKAHSITFDSSSYEGNPFLCGRPLSQNCSHGELPPIMEEEDKNVDDVDGWIDMDAFYVTFAGSYVTMFLAVVVILWVNPHWRKTWFNLVKFCIFSSCKFLKDSVRKLGRARSVSWICTNHVDCI